MLKIRRAVLATVLSTAAVLGSPAPATAGPLDDLTDFVNEHLDSLAEQLREGANRLAQRRVRALRRIERLVQRDRSGDVAGAAAQARRVVSVLERSYGCTGPEDEEARQLMDALLEGLEADLGALRTDVDLGVGGIAGIATRESRIAERLVARAAAVAARASEQSDRTVRANLVARAARLAERARRIVRRMGGVAGPYDGVPSRTGTAAGAASLHVGGVESLTETVGALVTVTGRGELTSLRLDAALQGPASSVLRVGVPTAALLAGGTLPVGAGVDDVRVELESAAGVVEAVSGVLRLEAFDLRAKDLTATLDVRLPGDESLRATFDLADFLLLR